MTDYRTLVTTAPDLAHGVPIGHDGWRFCLEAVLPSQAGAIVGTAKVGTTQVASGDVWVDLTPLMVTCETVRGDMEFDRRGDPGVMSLHLKSPSHSLAPWLTTLDSFHGSGRRFRPGLVVRAGLHKSGEWKPLFTGEVEAWQPLGVDSDTYTYVEVTVVETSTVLVRSPLTVEFSETSALNAATAIATISRAADAESLGWPYQSLVIDDAVEASGAVTEFGFDVTGLANGFQGGETEGQALDVIRDVIVSGGFAQVRSDPRGQLEVVRFDGSTIMVDGGVLTVRASPAVVVIGPSQVIPDRVRILSDNAVIVNRAVYFAGSYSDIPGVTPAVDLTLDVADEESIRRYGEYVDTTRTPYTTSFPDLVVVAQRMLDNRSNLVNRIEEIGLDQRHWPTILGIELDAPITATFTPRKSPAEITATGRIRQIRHDVKALHENALHWTTSLGIDTTTLEAT